jgi:hypothetical protein
MRQKQQLNAEKLRQEKVQLVVDGGVHTCPGTHRLALEVIIPAEIQTALLKRPEKPLRDRHLA